MTQTYTLPGSQPEGKRPGGKVTRVIALVLLGVLAWVSFRAIERRSANTGDLGQMQLHQEMERRKQVFKRILPGAQLPDPFVFRGASRKGDTEAVWLRSDYDDSHAILLSGTGFDEARLGELLQGLAGSLLPRRQPLDEPGVEIDKRAPFAEEYRTVESDSVPVAVPRAWIEHWDEAVRFESLDESGAPTGLVIEIGDGREYPSTHYRNDGDGYWWALVDLSVRVGGVRPVYLVHAVHSEREPAGGALVDFLRALLGVR